MAGQRVQHLPGPDAAAQGQQWGLLSAELDCGSSRQPGRVWGCVGQAASRRTHWAADAGKRGKVTSPGGWENQPGKRELGGGAECLVDRHPPQGKSQAFR